MKPKTPIPLLVALSSAAVLCLLPSLSSAAVSVSPSTSDPSIAQAFCNQIREVSEFSRTYCYNATHIAEDYGDCLADGTVNSSSTSTYIASCPEWSYGDASLVHCHECGSQVACASQPYSGTVCSTTPTSSNDGVHPDLRPCSSEASAASRFVRDYPCLPNSNNNNDPSNRYIYREATCNDDGQESLQSVSTIVGCLNEMPYCHSCRDFDFCSASSDHSCAALDDALAASVFAPSSAPSGVPSERPSKQPTTTSAVAAKFGSQGSVTIWSAVLLLLFLSL